MVDHKSSEASGRLSAAQSSDEAHDNHISFTQTHADFHSAQKPSDITDTGFSVSVHVATWPCRDANMMMIFSLPQCNALVWTSIKAFNGLGRTLTLFFNSCGTARWERRSWLEGTRKQRHRWHCERHWDTPVCSSSKQCECVCVSPKARQASPKSYSEPQTLSFKF